MSNGELFHEKADQGYHRVLYLDGVRIIINNNGFEINVHDNTEIWEQLAVQHLREWIKWRKAQAELRESRDLSR